MTDAEWIVDHGLRGGILLPNNPPDADVVDHQLYDPYWEPLWDFSAEAGVPVHSHGGTGVPNFGKVPAAQLLYIGEFWFYKTRPFLHLLLSGVFERHERLRFVMTEQGAAWLPPLLEGLDRSLIRIRTTGATGELRYGDESVLPLTATEYFRRNCFVGVSQPKAPDVQAMIELGLDRFMWGSDYPHDEGTAPFAARTSPPAVFRVAGGRSSVLLGYYGRRGVWFRPRGVGPSGRAVGAYRRRDQRTVDRSAGRGQRGVGPGPRRLNLAGVSRARQTDGRREGHPDGLAAIDGELGAGDERGAIGYQPQPASAMSLDSIRPSGVRERWPTTNIGSGRLLKARSDGRAGWAGGSVAEYNSHSTSR